MSLPSAMELREAARAKVGSRVPGWIADAIIARAAQGHFAVELEFSTEEGMFDAIELLSVLGYAVKRYKKGLVLSVYWLDMDALQQVARNTPLSSR